MHTYENNKDIAEDSFDRDRQSLNLESNSNLLTDDDMTENMSSNDTEYVAMNTENQKDQRITLLYLIQKKS